MSVPATRWRTVIAGTGMMAAASLGVSAANWGLNVILTRLLTPAQFGDASVAMAIVLLTALVATSLQLAAAKAVASHPGSSAKTRRVLLRLALAGGIAVAAGLAASAGALTEALGLATPWMLIVLAAGLPVYFVQAVYRGVTQGELQLGRLALSYGVEAVVRVMLTVALVAAGVGPLGVAIAIAVSFCASALVARGPARPTGDGSVPWRTLRVAATGAALLLGGQVLINNADIVIAKLAFTPETAGVYAAAAVLGRAVFFVSWAVVQAMFPSVASASGEPGARRRMLGAASVLVLGIAFGAVLAAVLWAEPIIVSVFGPQYAAAAPLLAPYLAASGLFAVANLWASFDVAVGRHVGPVIVLAAGVVQTALLALFAPTPLAMVWVQVGVVAATVLVLGVQILRAEQRTLAPQKYIKQYSE